MNQETKISLVIPVFNEEPRLRELYSQLCNFLSAKAEIIFINDGSTDGSWSVLKQISAEDPRVKLLDFSRNFGKEIATSAGLHFVTGEAVIIMDADLEHPPALIPELIAKWQEGNEIVYTIRKYSKGTPFLKRWTSRLYYFLINKVAVVKLESGATDFRILDRKVVDAFNQFTERARFFRGLIDWLGYKKAKLEFVSPYNQAKGQKSYSFRKLWRLAVSGLTSFSFFPLKLAGYIGTLITFGSCLFLLIMLIDNLFIKKLFFTNISFVIVLNVLLSGITLMCLGFIALYIGNIQNEILNRPLYIIREKINFNK